MSLRIVILPFGCKYRDVDQLWSSIVNLVSDVWKEQKPNRRKSPSLSGFCLSHGRPFLPFLNTVGRHFGNKWLLRRSHVAAAGPVSQR